MAGSYGIVELFDNATIVHKTSPFPSDECFVFTYQDIHAATVIPYRDMLFFDDEKSNIKTVSKLGVTCVKLSKESGLTFAAVHSGLKQYREACLSRASLKDWFTPAPLKSEAEGSVQATDKSSDGLVEGLEEDT